jgi:hypothetical protein
VVRAWCLHSLTRRLLLRQRVQGHCQPHTMGWSK